MRGPAAPCSRGLGSPRVPEPLGGPGRRAGGDEPERVTVGLPAVAKGAADRLGRGGSANPRGEWPSPGGAGGGVEALGAAAASCPRAPQPRCPPPVRAPPVTGRGLGWDAESGEVFPREAGPPSQAAWGARGARWLLGGTGWEGRCSGPEFEEGAGRALRRL